jgi:hypothetical protein
MTLNDELTVIDETIAELERRRTEIINRMDLTGRTQAGNVITFPKRPGVVAASYTTPRHVW